MPSPISVSMERICVALLERSIRRVAVIGAWLTLFVMIFLFVRYTSLHETLDASVRTVFSGTCPDPFTFEIYAIPGDASNVVIRVNGSTGAELNAPILAARCYEIFTPRSSVPGSFIADILYEDSPVNRVAMDLVRGNLTVMNTTECHRLYPGSCLRNVTGRVYLMDGQIPSDSWLQGGEVLIPIELGSRVAVIGERPRYPSWMNRMTFNEDAMMYILPRVESPGIFLPGLLTLLGQRVERSHVFYDPAHAYEQLFIREEAFSLDLGGFRQFLMKYVNEQVITYRDESPYTYRNYAHTHRLMKYTLGAMNGGEVLKNGEDEICVDVSFSFTCV